MVKVASQVDVLAAEANTGYEAAPSVEPETTIKTAIHPQNQNLDIHPQEVTSTFVRTLIIFFY